MRKYAAIIGLGLLFVMGGLIGFFVIKAKVKAEILKAMVIDSKEHPGYKDWVTPFDADDSPSLRKMYVFNVTNAALFKAGLVAPNFAEVGPFVYQYFDPKTNVNFTDGGNRAEFVAEDTYVFRPDLSAFPSDTGVKIININPFYVGLVNAVGGEARVPYVIASGIFGLYLTNDALARAWGTSTVGTCLPSLPGICGLAMFNSGAIPLTADQSVAMLTSLSDPTKLGILFGVVPVLTSPSSTTLERQGALLTLQAASANASWGGLPLERYGPQLLTYVNAVAAGGFTTAQTLFGGSLGLLFREATPRDWLFTPDPLLSMLGKRYSLYTNNSVYSYTVRTGKDDESFAGMNFYERYQGVTNVTAYEEPYLVASRTKSINPFGGVPPDRMTVYFSTAQRHLSAIYTAVEDVKGIETAVYVFEAEKIVKADPKYKTFVDGMVTLQPLLGIPLFLSVPHMWYVPTKYTSLVTGMKQERKYESKLFIEEFTGIALRGERQLQVNVLLDFKRFNYSGFVPQSPEIFVPLMYEVESGEISDSSAASLKKAVVDAAIAQKAILGVLVGLGIAMILIGATLMVQLTTTQNKKSSEATDKTNAKDGNEVSDLPPEDGLFVASNGRKAAAGDNGENELEAVGPSQ